jgi:antitoxin VapB
MKTTTTRVFNNGNSQAVRIPAEFRLSADKVTITQAESGDLIIQQIRADRGTAILEALSALNEADPHFAKSLDLVRSEQPPMQDRTPL